MDIIFPKVKYSAVYNIYNDVFKVYVEYGDNYDYKLVDKLDKDLPEGVYCYTNKAKGVDIMIHPGDVVIDAGAWAGDFSAYAAKKGAVVYAFEPAPSTIALLKQTIQYNNLGDKINIVESGLGDSNRTAYIKEEGVSGGNSISGDGSIPIKIIRLDDFVIQNKLEKVDFIKADIEGEERNMLAGAREVLKNFSPTLSICTYHLADDPQVLEAMILDANPRYKVIQRKMKLFAYVEKS